VQPSASIQIIATSVADPSKSAAVTQTVQGILLSQTTGTPGSALTLTGNFNTSAPLLVTFSDGMSFQPTISVTPSSTSQTIIIVPLYVTSSGFVQGTVTINAAQQSGSSMLTIGSAPGFIIDALPAATGSTGAVTLAVLKNAYAATAETQNLWTLVGSGSGGSVSTAGITAATSDMQTHLLNLIGSVSQVAGGGSAFMIGTISGSPMQIGTNNLATMDALLEAFYINSPAVQAAISSLPASTLAHLMIPVHGRTPEENLRAFANLSPSSFPSSTGTYLLGVALAVLTAELELPAIAVTAVLYCVIYAIAPEALNQLMKQAAQTIFSNISDLIGMQNAEADITIAQSSISSAGATLSGDYASLDSDLQNLGTLLDPSNPSSPGSEANSDQPTESKNAPPTTASDSTPTLTATGYTVPSTGEILVNVWVQNAPPNIQYSVSTTWGETETVTTDSYGYGFQALVTPVPASGSCYQGTVSLTDSNRNVVASTSGCWGAVTSYAFTMINYPGTQFTSLTGMNDSGQIVGNYGIGGSDCQSFLYSGGTFTTIVYPVSGGDYATCLVGINDSGSMVGEFTSFQSTGGTPPGFSGGFFLYSGGAFTLIEAPFPSGAGAPTGINKSGQIVGCYSGPVISGGVESAVTHGFIYSEGAFTTIDYPGANYYTCPTSINNKGQIVGTYGDSSTDQHGFLYSNGTFTTIDEPGYSGINLNGINDSGVIVGDGDGGAFVYSNGVFTPFSGSGGGAPYMSGILDNGQIVGIINSGTSVQGFVATPSQ
jgi:probable HAF family extracellular repeat protein